MQHLLLGDDGVLEGARLRDHPVPRLRLNRGELLPAMSRRIRWPAPNVCAFGHVGHEGAGFDVGERDDEIGVLRGAGQVHGHAQHTGDGHGRLEDVGAEHQDIGPCLSPALVLDPVGPEQRGGECAATGGNRVGRVVPCR